MGGCATEPSVNCFSGNVCGWREQLSYLLADVFRGEDNPGEVIHKQQMNIQNVLP